MEQFLQDVAATPSSDQDSSAGQDVSAESSAAPNETQEEKVPWGKDPRWQKWQKEERPLLDKYKQENQQYQQFLNQNSQALQWWQALQQNPEKLKAVVQVLTQEKAQQQQGNDPYAEYDPLIAQKLHDYDAAMQRLDRIEQSWQSNEATAKVSANLDSLSQNFDKLCLDSQVKSEPHQRALGALVINEMQKMLGDGSDPRLAPLHIQAEAFKRALPILTSIRDAERKGLETPSVPPSGSKTGVAPRQTGWGSNAERIQQMVDELY